MKFIISKNYLTPEKRAQLKYQWEEMMRTGVPMILDGGIEFKYIKPHKPKRVRFSSSLITHCHR